MISQSYNNFLCKYKDIKYSIEKKELKKKNLSPISSKNFVNSIQMQEQLLRNKFCTNRNIKVTKRILMPGHKMLFFKYKKTKQDHFSTNYASIRNLFRYLERTLQIQNQLGCIMSRLFLNTSCSQFGEFVVCSTDCVVFEGGILN